MVFASFKGHDSLLRHRATLASCRTGGHAIWWTVDRPQAGTWICRFIAGQRAWYRHFPRQRSVNLVVADAPGPPVPLYLAAARLLELFPMMPVMGNLTLVVARLSYTGQLNLTAVADRDRCPDLEVFTQGVRSALDNLARSALAPAS